MLSRRIADLAQDAASPSGGRLRLLRFADAQRLARAQGVDLLEVEQTALEAGIVPEHYSRGMDAITAAEQLALLRSDAALVGLGGLGGHVLESLARAGVGRIRAADGDVFEPSNLNRQLLATTATVGRGKADAARERCKLINPAVRFATTSDFLDGFGMSEMVRGADLALDALGDLHSRRSLARACRDEGVPLVAGALAGWSGYVALVRPGGTHPVEFMGGDDSAEKKLGCPAPTVAVIASLMAAEAVNLLLNRPTLDGRMLVVDLKTMSFETVTL
jgi:molybdopterin/thiamine biosynthesis adenylyltransferase